MSYDHGPLRTYEITWKSGHVERVPGHQVMFDSMRPGFGNLTGGALGTAVSHDRPPRFTIHGQFGPHWRLVLTALESELVSLRDVTDAEPVPEGGAA